MWGRSCWAWPLSQSREARGWALSLAGSGRRAEQNAEAWGEVCGQVKVSHEARATGAEDQET